MNILILEPGYADSLWCKQLVHGLCGELKKRREDYAMRSATEGVTGTDAVFVIGSIFSWLRKTVLACNAAGCVPVVLSNCKRIEGARYHSVLSDIAGSMTRLTAALKRACGDRIALYGINPESVGDRARAEAFLQVHPGDVFENSVSLADCYDRFAPHVKDFDAVVCANGFAAVSLVKRLGTDDLKRLRIISCAQSLLARYCREHIVSVDMNLGSFGKVALGIADLARKQPLVSELSAAVKWSVEGLELESLPSADATAVETGLFYSDRELQRMLRLENLLGSCDDTDMTILSLLLAGKSTAHMADACFLTEGAVKYRIKNMRRLCGAEDRNRLVALLREYMTEE